MTTVVNNPPPEKTGDEMSFGLILCIILGAILVILFIIFGIPALRNARSQSLDDRDRDIELNINLPDRSNDSESSGDGEDPGS